MSQLIHMRQRIKAIKTIKKITDALRLISISTHLRLRSKKISTEYYKETISNLFLNLYGVVKEWRNNLIKPEHTSDTTLIVLIGSKKGLCGNFNTTLYAFLEHEMAGYDKQKISFITVGKKAHDFATMGHKTVIKHFDELSLTTLESTSKSIMDYILQTNVPHESVFIFSNTSKSFFVQQPKKTLLLPFSLLPTGNETEEGTFDEYSWEQKPQEILDYLIEQFLYITLYELLFQSLIAEQAARFIAMDNSTRSAGKLLDSMQLQYNKMRQSKITGELTDLIGGFF